MFTEFNGDIKINNDRSLFYCFVLKELEDTVEYDVFYIPNYKTLKNNGYIFLLYCAGTSGNQTNLLTLLEEEKLKEVYESYGKHAFATLIDINDTNPGYGIISFDFAQDNDLMKALRQSYLIAVPGETKRLYMATS